MSGATPTPSRLRAGDTVRVAFSGLRARPLRAVLSALGIAVGIAAMVTVVGISASSREQVADQLRQLGTNLLTVTPGQQLLGGQATLPPESVDMVARIGPVTDVSAVGQVPDASLYRNDQIPVEQTNGIAVNAARPELLDTVSGAVASGRWLDDALATYPTVVGVLQPVPLPPELDTAALVGWPIAAERLGFDGAPTTIYERSDEAAVADVRRVLPATVNPAHLEEVAVSRPSDALAARSAADETLTTLLLALGGVALLVGGIGVANSMVIAVLERRSEIGLRRALGATGSHVRRQFLGESVLLAGLGGAGGALLGGMATAAFASAREWPLALPAWVLAGAAGATVVVGAIAGRIPPPGPPGCHPPRRCPPGEPSPPAKYGRGVEAALKSM